MVRRLGTGVAPGGTLLLVGHRPVDPATGARTPAAGQVQVSVDDAVDALDSHEWHIAVAEERPRAAVGTGVDAVVRAVRRRQRVGRPSGPLMLITVVRAAGGRPGRGIPRLR